MSKPSDKAASLVGVPDLAERLAALPGSVWTSLQLDVARRRAEARRPSDVLAQQRRDAFVRPSDLSQRVLREVDLAILSSLPEGFEAVELSPVAPLGTVTAVAKASQNKVCSAQRSLEVVSDPTNAMALLAVDRRRAGAERVRLFTSHRALRMQRVNGPLSWQHFRIATWITAGRDPGGRRFEAEALQEHLRAQLAALEALRERGADVGPARVTACVEARHRGWVEPLLALPELEGAEHTELPDDGYYRGLRFVLDVELDGERTPIADGGFVDWTAQLMNDRKERLFIGGMGTERLATTWG